MAAFLIMIYSMMVIVILVFSIRVVDSFGGKGRHVLRLKLSLMLFAGMKNSVVSENGLCISTATGDLSFSMKSSFADC
jgi:hypothetical protein